MRPGQQVNIDILKINFQAALTDPKYECFLVENGSEKPLPDNLQYIESDKNVVINSPKDLVGDVDII